MDEMQEQERAVTAFVYIFYSYTNIFLLHIVH